MAKKQKEVEEEKKSIVPNTESFIGLVQDKVAEGNEIEAAVRMEKDGERI